MTEAEGAPPWAVRQWLAARDEGRAVETATTPDRLTPARPAGTGVGSHACRVVMDMCPPLVFSSSLNGFAAHADWKQIDLRQFAIQ